MPKKIYKAVLDANSKRDGIYPLHMAGPKGAKPISVGVQASSDGSPQVCCWFECDPSQPHDEVAYTLYCVGTGHGAVPEKCRFLGTVVVGPYTWHYYTEQ